MNCLQCSAPLVENSINCAACGAPITSAPIKDPLIGKRLINQYIIKKQLGKGGFGAVYEAEQPSIGRKVAVKALHAHLSTNPTIVSRFHREGMAASRLEHSSAIKVFNSGETEEGILWLAMEFLEGESLEAKIKREGSLSPEELLTILTPVCEVLEEAHEKGIHHRDLKPDNIMLVPSRQGTIIKLLDFGLANLVEDESVTQSGMISGTPTYMPPEQWQGLKTTDHRSDIYSLGIIAYRGLSGQLPFQADTAPEWMKKHCLDEPAPLPPIKERTERTAAIEAVLDKAMAKELDQRTPSVTQFIEELRAAVEGRESLVKVSSAVVESKPESQPTNVLNRPAKAPGLGVSRQHVMIAAGVFLVVMLVVVFSLGEDKPKKRKKRNQKEVTTLPSRSPECQPGDLLSCQRSCDEGNFSSCVVVGEMFESGQGIARDLVRARLLYQRSCDGSVFSGCVRLGYLQEVGLGVAPDAKKALPLYQKACEGDELSGCAYEGRLHASGRGTKRDIERGAALLQKSCARGEMLACVLEGNRLQQELNRAGDAKELYEKSCSAGNQLGCVWLGSMYQAGAAVEMNTGRAKDLYQAACDSGEEMGCARLGVLYQTGTSVARDTAKAAELYQRACEAGELSGCVSVASLYKTGVGLTRDVDKSLSLYKKACDGGEEAGCAWLSDTYRTGLGVARDLNRSFSLAKESCERGGVDSCVLLGRFYETGMGAESAPDMAAAIYQRLCSNGILFACSRLSGAYFYGVGLLKDEGEAKAFANKSCDGGDIDGCAWLGMMIFESAVTLPNDSSKSAELYQRACDSGSMWGCSLLASFYMLGEVVTKDEGKAVSLMRQSCEGGDLFGCAVAGIWSAVGAGGSPDPVRGLRLLRDTCDSGEPSACAAEAFLLMRGEVTPQNIPQAKALAERACLAYSDLGCDVEGSISLDSGDAAKAAELFARACSLGAKERCVAASQPTSSPLK